VRHERRAPHAELGERPADEVRLLADGVAVTRLLRPAVAEQVDAHDAMVAGEVRHDAVPPVHRAHPSMEEHERSAPGAVDPDLEVAARQLEDLADVRRRGLRLALDEPGVERSEEDEGAEDRERPPSPPAPSPRVLRRLPSGRRR
jgi:hypothetical protein